MGPDDKTTVAWKGGGELGGDKGLGDAPNEGKYEEAQYGPKRPSSSHS